MSQFRLQDNVPDIYVSESRDFQLLLRLYDSIFGGLRFDIDGMQSLTDTMHIKNTMLPLLATKLGFFSNIDIEDKSLRYILSALPYFLKYKGSLYGVKQVVNLYLKIMNVKASVLISYSKDPIGNILDHSIQLGSDVTFTNLPLLRQLLNLILPVGFVVYYYHFVSLDTALTAIEETDEIILLGKIISTTQSVLRSDYSNTDPSYYNTDWVDSRYDIHQPSTVDDDEIIIEAKERLYGAVSIMQLAGSEDEQYIPEFEDTATYKVGDVVKYSNSYYQCIVDVNVAGSWTGDTNWTELIYYV